MTEKKYDVFKHPKGLLIIGPSGTGKTTFMASYVESHYKRFQQTNYWLVKPSIVELMNEQYLPKYIIATDDLLDERFAGIRKAGERTCVVADEVNRLLSKYDHASPEARAFGDFVGLHRHKGVDLLMSDQAFDFLYAARVRAHQIVFTGINEMLYNVLKQHLTPKLIEFLMLHKPDLLALGEKNKNTIEKGYGRVILTNGYFTKIVKFKRPEWYTKEFSHIWRNISAEDLRRDQMREKPLPEFEPDSDEIQALYLAYHIARAKFGKVTKEKFAGAYPLASKILTGKAKILPDSGRGRFELTISTHNAFCTWCRNKTKLQEVIEIAGEITNVTKDNIKQTDEILAQIL